MLVIAALALAAVCASAIPASAQAAYKGSFTLTHGVAECKTTGWRVYL
jgi:hypothetical protein